MGVLLSAVAFVMPSGTGNGEIAATAALRGRAAVLDSISTPEEQHAPGVRVSKSTTRRSGLVLLAALGGFLTAGSRAEAKKKNKLGDDDDASFSSSSKPRWHAEEGLWQGAGRDEMQTASRG